MNEKEKKLLSMIMDARNELCLLCGSYHDAHNGACNFCKWNHEHMERLQDETKNTTNWIKCSERIPEPDTLVILAVYGQDIIVLQEGETLAEAVDRTMKKGHIDVGYYSSDEQAWNNYSGFPQIVSPTYWMPFPELPKLE